MPSAPPRSARDLLACVRQVRYLLIVTGSPPSPEEIRAAAEIHRELGPEYDKAVVESFLARLGPEIDARVDARVAQDTQAGGGPARGGPMSPAALALGSIGLGIPITAIVSSSGSRPVGFMGVLVVWLAIAAINIAYTMYLRPRNPR
jgi:hypothetical protein